MQQLTVSQVCLVFFVLRTQECGKITDLIMLQINNLFMSDIPNPKRSDLYSEWLSWND